MRARDESEYLCDFLEVRNSMRYDGHLAFRDVLRDRSSSSALIRRSLPPKISISAFPRLSKVFLCHDQTLANFKRMLFLTITSRCRQVSRYFFVFFVVYFFSPPRETLFRRMKFHGRLSRACSLPSPGATGVSHLHFSRSSLFCRASFPRPGSARASIKKLAAASDVAVLLRLINAQIMRKYREQISLTFRDETADVFDAARVWSTPTPAPRAFPVEWEISSSERISIGVKKYTQRINAR